MPRPGLSSVPPALAVGEALRARPSQRSNESIPYARIAPRVMSKADDDLNPIKSSVIGNPSHPYNQLDAGRVLWLDRTKRATGTNSGTHRLNGVAGEVSQNIVPIASTSHINFVLRGMRGTATCEALGAALIDESSNPNDEAKQLASEALVRNLAVPDGIVKGRFEPEEGGFEMALTHSQSAMGQMYNISVYGPTLATEWSSDLEEFARIKNERAGLTRAVALNAYGINECNPLEYVYLGLVGEQESVSGEWMFQYVPMSRRTIRTHFFADGMIMEETNGSTFDSLLCGAWKIGAVMDTSASRIFVPSGSSGAKLLRKSGASALTVAVNPEWFCFQKLMEAVQKP